MFKKLVIVSSVVHIALTIVVYITLAYQFNSDKTLVGILANTDLIATLLRLTLYVVPGLYLLGGLIGLVFKEKKLLIFMSLLLITSSIFMINIANNNGFLMFIGIVALVFSVTYLVGTILAK